MPHEDRRRRKRLCARTGLGREQRRGHRVGHSSPEGGRGRLEVTVGQLGLQSGEGVIVRNPLGVWTPKRVPNLLKYKPFDDDEGVVIGFTSGGASAELVDSFIDEVGRSN